jgi:hypothetical protein
MQGILSCYMTAATSIALQSNACATAWQRVWILVPQWWWCALNELRSSSGESAPLSLQILQRRQLVTRTLLKI